MKLKNMFKRRLYTIKFKKDIICVRDNMYGTIDDYTVILTILELKEKYNFDIVSLVIEDQYNDSLLKIRCDRNDKDDILSDLCKKLSNTITNIRMR